MTRWPTWVVMLTGVVMSACTGEETFDLACLSAVSDGGVGMAEGACIEHHGTVVPRDCADVPGYVPVDRCPDEDRVALCEFTTTTMAGRTRVRIYSYAPVSIENARFGCDALSGELTEL